MAEKRGDRIRKRDNALAVIREYPNSFVLRGRSIRHWAVPKEFATGTRRPVVILPGVYETWHYLRPVCEALNEAGHPVEVLPELGLNQRPIAASAQVVWRVLVERDLHDVALVAHSKGGLIGKHLLAFDDREGRIERLVAIATPFLGTSMAHLGVLAMREFRPEVPVISTLMAESSVHARITSIYPAVDSHIPEGSEVEGGRNIELPVTGHFRILLDPSLPQVVVEAVESPREPRLGDDRPA
jgi:hypothetical protein